MATGFSAPQPAALPRALFTATGPVLSATLNSQSGFNLQETSRHLPAPVPRGGGQQRAELWTGPDGKSFGIKWASLQLCPRWASIFSPIK